MLEDLGSRHLTWYFTHKLKLACFVSYLKVINTFLENKCILKQIVQGPLSKMALEF